MNKAISVGEVFMRIFIEMKLLAHSVIVCGWKHFIPKFICADARVCDRKF